MVMGFGIDIGGTGTKGAPVDLEKGKLAADRFRIPTPKPATPEAVAEVAREIVERFPEAADVPQIGVAIPAVVQHGVARSAANIDPSWIDTDVDALFTEVLGRAVHVVNDADAAGVAENDFGAAADEHGLVCVITLGTGIGSALINAGTLVPNTEFGHLEVDGHDAETRAAASVKEDKDLTWEEWAVRVSRYVRSLEDLIWPDLIIAGGGVSKKADKWLPLLDVRTRVVAAELRNDAGIVGAARAAKLGHSG